MEKICADNLAYIGFRRRFFSIFYWCLVLVPFIYSEAPNSVGSDSISDRCQHTKLRQYSVGDGFPSRNAKRFSTYKFFANKTTLFSSDKTVENRVVRLVLNTLATYNRKSIICIFAVICGTQIIPNSSENALRRGTENPSRTENLL